MPKPQEETANDRVVRYLKMVANEIHKSVATFNPERRFDGLNLPDAITKHGEATVIARIDEWKAEGLAELAKRQESGKDLDEALGRNTNDPDKTLPKHTPADSKPPKIEQAYLSDNPEFFIKFTNLCNKHKVPADKRDDVRHAAIGSSKDYKNDPEIMAWAIAAIEDVLIKQYPVTEPKETIRDLFKVAGLPVNFEAATGYKTYEAAIKDENTFAEIIEMVKGYITEQLQKPPLSGADITPENPIAPNEQAGTTSDNAVEGELVNKTTKASNSPENKAAELPVIDAPIVEPDKNTKALAVVEKKSDVALGGRTIFPGKDEMAIMRQMAESAIKSGLLPYAIKNADAALYIIETGRELGISPTLALRKIQIIQGQPTLAAELMWALVNNSGLLEDYSIEEADDHCTVMVKRVGKQPYKTTFSLDMARKIMTKEDGKVIPLTEKYNWRAMPRVMCKWRAIAAACRTIFPDVTLGLYANEEMEEAA